MEEHPVNSIRESSRNVLKLNRRFLRDEEADIRRCVDNKRISTEIIQVIANKLKTKTSVSAEDLQTLKNGLMEDPKYIEIVLSTHGALRGLVRELSGAGSQYLKQCLAAACCCNLALGDSKAGFTVAKAAGPYLTAALDSLSIELSLTCAWAIGNVCGSGVRACEVAQAQGGVAKLAAMLAGSGEGRDAAVYALVHFTVQMKDELGTDHLKKILDSLLRQPITTESSQLLFILSCHSHFTISHEQISRILNETSVSIQSSDSSKSLYLIRTLANISLNEEVYVLIVDSLAHLVSSLKVLLQKGDVVSKSLVWLLGNLYNFHSDSALFVELLK